MRTLWQHCHAATMAGGRYSVIEDAAIVTSAGLIEWIGPRDDVPPVATDRIVDLGGAWVTPGLIDCHTHAVFGGNRSGEFEQRLQGVSYAEIAAQGGGIASTVRATRAASEDELFASARQRVQALMRDGLTCIEIKSGYGLTWQASARCCAWPGAWAKSCRSACAPPAWRPMRCRRSTLGGRMTTSAISVTRCSRHWPAKVWWMRWTRSASTWRSPGAGRAGVHQGP